jgi:hypothetical protein
VNHIAVVEDGRAGTSKIMDSRGNMSKAKDSKLKQVLDALGDFVKKYAGGQDEQPECTCGGKKQHSDACACYQAEDGEPWEEATTDPDKPEGSSGSSSGASGEVKEEEVSPEEMAAKKRKAAMADDETAEEMEEEYERTGGPERKLKGFTNVTPTEGSGKGSFVNPVSAKDARTALQNLNNPALRKLVKAQGHTAIDAYNKAYRAIRQQIVASEQYERVLAADSRSRRRSEAADFEAQAARFHGKAIRLHQPPNSMDEDDTRLGADSREEVLRGEEAAADFETQAAQFHRRDIKRR